MLSLLAHSISFNMCGLLICLPVVVVVFSHRLKNYNVEKDLPVLSLQMFPLLSTCHQD